VDVVPAAAEGVDAMAGSVVAPCGAGAGLEPDAPDGGPEDVVVVVVVPVPVPVPVTVTVWVVAIWICCGVGSPGGWE
jgi:hypothetical protein